MLRDVVENEIESLAQHCPRFFGALRLQGTKHVPLEDGLALQIINFYKLHEVVIVSKVGKSLKNSSMG